MASAMEKAGEMIGIDLGDKMSHYAIVTQPGEVVEEGTFRNQVSSRAYMDTTPQPSRSDQSGWH